MNLKFFHMIKLLHNSLVTMATEFPWQPGTLFISIITIKTYVLNMTLKYLQIAELYI